MTVALAAGGVPIGKVVSVADGDTLTILVDQEITKVAEVDMFSKPDGLEVHG